MSKSEFFSFMTTSPQPGSPTQHETSLSCSAPLAWARQSTKAKFKVKRHPFRHQPAPASINKHQFQPPHAKSTTPKMPTTKYTSKEEEEHWRFELEGEGFPFHNLICHLPCWLDCPRLTGWTAWLMILPSVSDRNVTQKAVNMTKKKGARGKTCSLGVL